MLKNTTGFVNKSTPPQRGVTPSFPVELSGGIERSSLPLFDEKMKKIEESLQETGQTRQVGWGLGVKKSDFVYLQPHNYSLFFVFSRENFSFFSEENPTVGNRPLGSFISTGDSYIPLEAKNINSGKEFFIRFKNYSVRIKKSLIEVKNNFEPKRIYAVDKSGSIDSVKSRVLEIEREKQRQSIGFLRGFVAKYGGKTDFKIVKKSDFTKNCEVTHWDKKLNHLLPLGQTWVSDVAKRVYPHEKKVESFGLEYNANLIRNMMIADVAPLIASELAEIKALLPFDVSVFKSRIDSVQDFLDLLDDIEKLPSAAKDDLTAWFWSEVWSFPDDKRISVACGGVR